MKSEELVKVFYEVDSLPKGVEVLSMVVILRINKSIDNLEILY